MKRRSANPGSLKIITLLGLLAGINMMLAEQTVYGFDDAAALTESSFLPSDIVGDGIVNLADFGLFSQYWLIADCNVPDWCQGTDLDRNGIADMNDLLMIADYWLVIGDVNVPDVNGLTLLQAQSAIIQAGLVVGTVTQQFSDTVPAGSVISQNPPAGEEVPHGTAVDLIVSQGVAPVIVPDVAGMTQTQAEAAIADAGLVAGTVTQQFSNTVPAGSVISQNPPAGEEVPHGTAVDLIVSQGVAPVIVPDVAGMTQTQAEAAIADAGLVAGTVTQQFSDTVPAGSVISQNPPAGFEVPPGTMINLGISLGIPISVPDVVGLPQAQAEAAIATAGLSVGTTAHQFSQTVPFGSIISQQPAAGIEVTFGTSVDLVISQGVPLIVPDLTGMTTSQAQAAITAANLMPGSVTQEPSAVAEVGCVGRQFPAAGAHVAQGTAVNLFVSTGPTYFYVAKNGSNQNDGSCPTDQGHGVGPFATIQKGLTVLANRDAVGDVLCIREGTYYEECTSFGGINAVGPVVIRNYDNEEVCIDGGEPVTGWTPCDPNEASFRVCGMMPPGWDTYRADVYKAQVAASQIYAISDRPYYGVKLVYENELLRPCGVINMPYAVFPDLENFGWNMTSGTTVSIRDVTHLTEPNGFWGKAFVWFIGKQDNIAYCRTIHDSNALENTITFDACQAGVDWTRKYWIFNHPHLLNDPGEYYWDPNDANGYYTVYYYKRSSESVSDLNSRMKVLSKTAGIRFAVSSSNLIIEGLQFRNCQTRGSYDYRGVYINGGPTGQSGLICATNWCNSMAGITIRNCTFENFYGNEGAAIVFGECEQDIVIDNCIVRDVGRGAGIRTYGESNDKTQGVIIRNCTLERVWSSNIRPYFADNVQITGNTVSQFDGVHGNAVTVYGSCDNVLIAHNVITGGTNALVMKDTNGMYIFGNVFRSTDDSGSVSIWDVDYRAVTGNLYVLHNTILTSSTKPKALFFLKQKTAYPPTANVVIKNNILDGLEYAADWNPVITHDFNLYLEESTHQAGRCPQCAPWLYGADEILDFDGHPQAFTDYAGQVYTLQPTSHAVSAGTGLAGEIDVMQTAFPFYDFSVDLDGTVWQSPPSMGAFELVIP